MSQAIAIYIRRNTINGKEYIGQSVNPLRRWREESYGESMLGRALRKYGVDVFENTILFWVDSQDLANCWEMALISHRKTLTHYGGYNIRDGGSSGYSLAGKTAAEVELVRRRQSKSLKGRKLSDEHIRFLSDSRRGEGNPMYGKKHSAETKRRMSESGNRREPASMETRKKISDSRKGDKNWWHGRKHSDETRRKMSEGMTLAHKRKRHGVEQLLLFNLNGKEALLAEEDTVEDKGKYGGSR